MAMSSSAATAKMSAWKKRLRDLPAEIARVPEQLAKTVKADLDSAIAAGKSVEGASHTELRRPKDAHPTAKLQESVQVSHTSDSILIRLLGGMVYREYGTGRQAARPILGWENGLPPKLGRAIRAGLVEVWHKVTDVG